MVRETREGRGGSVYYSLEDSSVEWGFLWYFLSSEGVSSGRRKHENNTKEQEELPSSLHTPGGPLSILVGDHSLYTHWLQEEEYRPPQVKAKAPLVKRNRRQRDDGHEIGREKEMDGNYESTG